MFTTETNVPNVRPKNLASNLRCGAFALITCGLLAAPASAQKVEIQLSNGILPTARLAVGDDLFAGLTSSSPGTTYDFRLLSAEGLVISSASGIADAAGNVEPQRIWGRSGVVGCDCAAGPDLELYRFETYQQAEFHLNGQTLKVQVLSEDGVEVAVANLPVMVTGREISYFSNAAGCPRKVFAVGEPIYMSFLRADRTRTHRRIFLAESTSWPIGQSILDVRGNAQWSALPTSTSSVLTLPLSGSITRTGGFDAVIRHDSNPDSFRFDSDLVLGNVIARDSSCPESGIIVTVDGCPNCGGGGGGGAP